MVKSGLEKKAHITYKTVASLESLTKHCTIYMIAYAKTVEKRHRNIQEGSNYMY